MITTDHIDNITVDENECNNELVTLDALNQGLFRIYSEVKQVEQTFSSKRINAFGHGISGLNSADEALISCYFHWFGITLCNVVRLNGFLIGISRGIYDRACVEDSSKFSQMKETVEDYFNSISALAPVKTWRNKVYAHFALTDPRSADNAALLDVSAMSPLSIIDSRFGAGGFIFNLRGHEIEMPTWKLTEIYEHLIPRYWPRVVVQT